MLGVPIASINRGRRPLVCHVLTRSRRSVASHSHDPTNCAGSTKALGRFVLLGGGHACRSCLGARLGQAVFGHECPDLLAGVLSGGRRNQQRNSKSKNKGLYHHHRSGNPKVSSVMPGLCMSCHRGAIAFATTSEAIKRPNRRRQLVARACCHPADTNDHETCESLQKIFC
jgi:hypothetical protein